MDERSPDSHVTPSLLRVGAQAIVIAVVVLMCFSTTLVLFGAWYNEWSGLNAQMSVSDGMCSVAVVPIVGDIVPFASAPASSAEGEPLLQTSADAFVQNVRRALGDPYIKGILVRIDSGGGWPIASKVMADALRDAPVPVVALIRDIGTSGAYLAATGADVIVAEPSSDVGAIGVTMSYLDETKKNEKEGLSFVGLASGLYKDAGHPSKPLTDEERALFERDLKVAHDDFVSTVAANRNMDPEAIAAVADGASMPGIIALEKGLIDGLGNETVALQWIADSLEIPLEEVTTCFPLY